MVMIDAHLHLGSITDKKREWGSFSEYEKIAKKLGIEKYCLVPIGLPDNFTKKTTPDNNSVLKEYEKNKSVIPVYWFNIFDLPQKINDRYKAIKFHPDIGEINLDDDKVVNFVNKIKLPVFVHTNENKEYSNLGRVSELARKVDVPIIAVHSGSVTKTFFRLDDYSFSNNVYFETSGIQYAIILKKIYEMFGASRIIFGSDYPFGDPRVPLAMIDTLNLSKQEYYQVTKENITKLLKLK